MAAVTISLQLVDCYESSCQSDHPNVRVYVAMVKVMPEAKPIGDIKSYVFNKSAMDSISPTRMWEECQNFDDHHADTKLDKIDNFLANESFPTNYKSAIAEAEAILFIDQVWLEQKFRGRDLGLAAVKDVMVQLALPTKTVVMLQAGAIRDFGSGDAFDAGEKLAKHWGRLGFEPWSESDDSWLLLSLPNGKSRWKSGSSAVEEYSRQ